MSKFLLFICPHYYPSGGVFDFAGAYEDLDSAKAAYREDDEHKNAHIARLEGDAFVVVAEFPNAYNDDTWSDGPSEWRKRTSEWRRSQLEP